MFSVVKHFFKLARLECIQLGKKEDMVGAIKNSFDKVNIAEIRNMIIRSN